MLLDGTDRTTATLYTSIDSLRCPSWQALQRLRVLEQVLGIIAPIIDAQRYAGSVRRRKTGRIAAIGKAG